MCIAFLSDPLLSSRSKHGFETFPSQLNQSIMEFDPLCLCVEVVQKGIVQIYMKLVPGVSTTLMKESNYTPLQSCLSVERSTGSLGVIGNAELF